MDPMQPPGLLLTGTDTEVGKTWITTQIARELRQNNQRVGVYKPVCSGSATRETGEIFWPDIDALAQSIGHEFPLDWICPQRFHAPLAPPVAARMEGRTIDSQLLRTGCDQWVGQVDLLLVEGVGGLLCPVSDDETIAELAADIGYPLLIVARAGLGTINHTLLTIEVAQRRALPIAGIILNQCSVTHDQAIATNPDEIAVRTDVPLLGTLDFGSTCVRTPDPHGTIDWFQLACDTESVLRSSQTNNEC
jgi:dethiobiotin synthetase